VTSEVDTAGSGVHGGEEAGCGEGEEGEPHECGCGLGFSAALRSVVGPVGDGIGFDIVLEGV
jgi:hypothetical protein